MEVVFPFLFLAELIDTREIGSRDVLVQVDYYYLGRIVVNQRNKEIKTKENETTLFSAFSFTQFLDIIDILKASAILCTSLYISNPLGRRLVFQQFPRDIEKGQKKIHKSF